jgi:hypothetical protein
MLELLHHLRDDRSVEAHHQVIPAGEEVRDVGPSDVPDPAIDESDLVVILGPPASDHPSRTRGSEPERESSILHELDDLLHLLLELPDGPEPPVDEDSHVEPFLLFRLEQASNLQAGLSTQDVLVDVDRLLGLLHVAQEVARVAFQAKDGAHRIVHRRLDGRVLRKFQRVYRRKPQGEKQEDCGQAPRGTEHVDSGQGIHDDLVLSFEEGSHFGASTLFSS